MRPHEPLIPRAEPPREGKDRDLDLPAPATAARLVTWTIVLFAGAAIAWASLAELDVVVTAQGRVIPSGRAKVIQPLEGGVVRAIHVRDGQTVRQGDVLIELDPTTTTADRERLARDSIEAQIDVARLTAQLAGNAAGLVHPPGAPAAFVATHSQMLASRLAEEREKLAALDQDIARRRADRDAIAASIVKLDTTIPLLRKKHGMREELAKQGYTSAMALIDSNLDLVGQERELAVLKSRLAEAEAGLRAAERARQQAAAEHRSRTLTELADATKRRDAAVQELIKADQRRALQELRATASGTVQQLAVNTVGGVVTAAQTLLVIVPEASPLEIEAQVLNKDIGYVVKGQRAVVKVETFDFTRHGFIEGRIAWVGTDAVVDQKLGPVYPVRVALASTRIPNPLAGRGGELTAGMNVTADISVTRRRVIEYFLSPLLRYRNESLRER